MNVEFYKIINILKENCIDYNINYSDDEINKIANNLIKEIEVNNIYDLSYITKKIMKIVLGDYDSHTDIDFIDGNNNNINNTLPIKLKFEEGNLYIVDANDNTIKNTEIKEINGMPINQLVEEIKSITRYSTDEWLYKQVEDILSSSTQMKILPSLRNIDKVNYSVIKDELIENLSFDINKKYEDKFKRKEDNYSYIINGDTITMHLNACEKPKNYNSMAEYILHIDNVIKENKINNFVLDLRGNTGGNQSDIEHLRVYFQNILKDKKLKENKIENIGKDLNLNISCLVDRNVFSSASLFVSELQELNIPCMGENIGTTYNNFGNPTKHDLNDIGVRLYTSTRYFYRDENKNYKYTDNKEELKNVYQKNPDKFKIIENNNLKLNATEKKIYPILKKKQELQKQKKQENSMIKTLSKPNGFLDIIFCSIITIIIGLILFMIIR